MPNLNLDKTYSDHFNIIQPQPSASNPSKKVSKISLTEDENKIIKSKLQMESLSQNDSVEILKSAPHL